MPVPGRQSLRASIAATLQEQTGDLIGKPSVKHKIRVVAETLDEEHHLVREEWNVLRQYSDFVALHKQLKSQVTEEQPSRKFLSCRDSFGAPVALLPSLISRKAAVTGVSVGWKFVEQRSKLIDLYLQRITTPGHVLQTSTEVMKFLSCPEYVPADSDSDVYSPMDYQRTPLGPIANLSREDYGHLPLFPQNCQRSAVQHVKDDDDGDTPTPTEGEESAPSATARKEGETAEGATIKNQRGAAQEVREPEPQETSLVAERLRAVKVKEVQECGFELVKQLFHLDNATFIRSRIIEVIRGMSFLVTGNQKQVGGHSPVGFCMLVLIPSARPLFSLHKSS
uniref:PX domain-containing protein n=1 Tax=Corethron hystrix TaxID=216773 RepID=A0A7S1BE96_9STRA